jgi:hypothetical protein
MDYLPAGDLVALSQLLPQARFTAAQAMLARLREIKTSEEINILRRLSRIADKAITDAYRSVRAGSSEMDLAAALTRGIYEQGAEYFKLMIVATGERSVFPNVGPTSRVNLRNRIWLRHAEQGYGFGYLWRLRAAIGPPRYGQAVDRGVKVCAHHGPPPQPIRIHLT